MTDVYISLADIILIHMITGIGGIIRYASYYSRARLGDVALGQSWGSHGNFHMFLQNRDELRWQSA